MISHDPVSNNEGFKRAWDRKYREKARGIRKEHIRLKRRFKGYVMIYALVCCVIDAKMRLEACIEALGDLH